MLRAMSCATLIYIVHSIMYLGTYRRPRDRMVKSTGYWLSHRGALSKQRRSKQTPDTPDTTLNTLHTTYNTQHTTYPTPSTKYRYWTSQCLGDSSQDVQKGVSNRSHLQGIANHIPNYHLPLVPWISIRPASTSVSHAFTQPTVSKLTNQSV